MYIVQWFAFVETEGMLENVWDNKGTNSDMYIALLHRVYMVI